MRYVLQIIGVSLALSSCPWIDAGGPRVELLKTPDAGLQPQAIVDAEGNVHLVYFKGEPRAGDLFYGRRAAGKTTFSAPVRVNSQPNSAIALGTIRGGQLAVGKNGRVHVAWNGSDQALPKNPSETSPMLYARLGDDGSAFEPQRNVMTRTTGLDGGGTIAADADGNVYVAWHGQSRTTKGEGNRKVWIAASRDNGKTFAPERAAWDEPTGACGCCGMRAFVDRKGTVSMIYRAAAESINRGMVVLQSTDAGKTFAGTALDQWKIDRCPMSSEAFAEGPGGIVTAWDSQGQMHFTRFQSGKPPTEKPQSAPGDGRERKHPALAVNKQGEMLLVWTEGTGWNRGGTLAWQLYDAAGRPTAEAGRRPGGIPVWGLPAAVAEPDGRFTIWH